MIKSWFAKIFGQVPDAVPASELEQKISHLPPKHQVLDVRTPKEFEGGHIPGATNMDLMNPNFEQELQKLPAEHTYYVYCRSGMRSSQACKKMKNQGFNQVFNVKGGIMAWKGKVVQ